MIFPVFKHPSSFHRLLVSRVKLVSPSCRPISKLSAINKGLRSSRDEAEPRRGGRDRPRPSAQYGERSRTGSSSRSDAPQRPRNGAFGSGGRNRDRPAFKPRDDIRNSSRERPARDSKPSYGDRKEGAGLGGRDRSRPAFKPREDARKPDRDRPGRTSGSSFQQSRETRENPRPQSRLERLRKRETGFAGQPGFSFDRETGSEREEDVSRGRYDQSVRASKDSEEKGFSFGNRRERRSAPTEGSSSVVEAGMVGFQPEQSDRPRTGLLRDIKSACKLIKSIQKAEASGEDTSEMITMTNAVLRSVNVHVASGNFEDDPSEAVASLFQKKASEGTFYIDDEDAPGHRSILQQRDDGKIGLVKKRHVLRERASDARPARDEYSKDRTERYSKVEGGDRSDRVKSSRDTRTSRSADTGPEDDGIPISVPYTTAASEFLYGSNAVLAALRGKRRKLYQLYIHPKIFERESGMAEDRKSRYAKPAHEFVALAKEAGIPFRNEFRTSLLDKMSEGRPHNGIVLEASKLPAPPVLGLGKPDARRATIPLTTAPQSTEDIAVNGNPASISANANSWRHPFIVMLDGIVDPGNVGNIIRTCHFYGVDAVVVATNTCANLSSAVLAKASSGACEAVRILSLPQPSSFVHDSAKAGWKIYAAVAPVTGRQGKDAKSQLTTAAVATASPLVDHPCILMLGAEGEGLRENLKNRANAFVSISRGQQLNDSPDVGVDSMNVSVAAGVLLESFLRKPEGAPEKRDTAGELGF